MRKRITLILLVVLIGVFSFVSCTNENDPENSVGLVSFARDDSRAITSYNNFKVGEYYWVYDAVKVSNPSFNIGEVVNKPVNPKPSSKKPNKGFDESDTVGPFSYGEWKFTLRAYNIGYSDGEFDDLVWEGTANVIIKDKLNKVLIPLSPKQTIKHFDNPKDYPTGYITIPRDFSFVYEGKTYDAKAEGLYGKIFLTPINSCDIAVPREEDLSTYTTNITNVYSGSWNFRIELYDESGAKIAYSEKVVNVFDWQQIYIGGYLDGQSGMADFVPKTGTTYEVVDGKTVASTEADVSNTADQVIVVSTTPNKVEDKTRTTNIAIPNGALSEGGKAKVAITTDSTSSEGFEYQTSEGTSLGSIDIKLDINGKNVDTFNSPVTVKTYIAKNLPEGSVNVVHTKDGQPATPVENVVYDPYTGAISFTTSGFSKFAFVWNSATDTTIEALNMTTGKAYTNFASCMNDALTNTGADRIVLFKDITNKYGIEISNSVTLDLNGHEILFEGTDKGSFTRPLFTLNTGTDLTITGNGKITQPNDSVARPNMIYIDHKDSTKDTVTKLHIENGTFDTGNRVAIITQGLDKGKTSIVIDNGTFNGHMYFPNYADVTINGGTFSNTDCIIYQKAGSLTVNDGTFTTTGKLSSWSYNGSGNNATSDAIIVEACNYGGHGDPALNIVKGTFNTDPTRYGVVVLNHSDSAVGEQKAHEVTVTNIPASVKSAKFVVATKGTFELIDENAVK